MSPRHQMYLWINNRHCWSLKCSCGRVIEGTTHTTQADLISDHTAEIEEGVAV